MTPRAATRYLLWCGEKALAGDELTEEESVKFREARAVSIEVAHKLLRIKPEEYQYVPGEPYK